MSDAVPKGQVLETASADGGSGDTACSLPRFGTVAQNF